MKKKSLTVALAVALLAAAVVLGTLAFLTSKTDPVKNTFTVGNLQATLTETKKDFKIWPGRVIEKDPTATIKKGSEPCFVYVSIENQLLVNGKAVGTPNIDTKDWIQVATIPAAAAASTTSIKTLYRYKSTVDAAGADQTLPVFTTVAMDSTLTNDEVSSLADKQINIQAFAHQSTDTDETTAQAAAKTALGFPTTTP